MNAFKCTTGFLWCNQKQTKPKQIFLASKHVQAICIRKLYYKDGFQENTYINYKDKFQVIKLVTKMDARIWINYKEGVHENKLFTKMQIPENKIITKKDSGK